MPARHRGSVVSRGPALSNCEWENNPFTVFLCTNLKTAKKRKYAVGITNTRGLKKALSHLLEEPPNFILYSARMYIDI